MQSTMVSVPTFLTTPLVKAPLPVKVDPVMTGPPSLEIAPPVSAMFPTKAQSSIEGDPASRVMMSTR